MEGKMGGRKEERKKGRKEARKNHTVKGGEEDGR